MAEVLHTIKGNQYLYEHYREGDKVKSKYIGPVGSGGKVRDAKHGGGAPQKVTQQTAKVTSFFPKTDIKLYGNTREFVTDNINELKQAGINNMELADELFIKLRLVSFKAKPVNKQDAIEIINNNIPDGTINGWFRQEDKTYKPKLLNYITKSDETRSAGLEIMRYNYNSITGKNIPFNEFINKEIILYRGGERSTGDAFTSYSINKDIALKFQKQYHKDNIHIIKIKPKNTLGSYQTTSEAEVLIPEQELKN